MFTVYVLQSIHHDKLYTGFTENIDRRMSEHNTGKSKFTSAFRPWKIIYTEQVNTREGARKLEKYYKTAAGKRRLKHLIVGGSLPD
ncbi:MAG: GIY-YIG nuclease family protein [Bacteroidetes bacterium]|nr:GIY-YIG nuclease family protein [Bacteroidota bacterium]